MKKIVLSAIAAATLNAGWIEDNMIDLSTDDGYYTTQTRGLYTLGSKTIKFKEVPGTITPFHLEPPRFNVGCGGIDFSMGGFSYLKKDFIIEKLKAVSAAAPAFVYQMAISSLCKDCQNIMNELEKFSNMINGFNIDTCDIVGAAQGAGKALGEGMNNALSNGKSDSWMEQKVKSGREKMQDWGDSIKTSFGGDQNKADSVMSKMVLKGSYLDQALKDGLKNSLSQLDLLGPDSDGDKLLISSIRAITGDIVGGTDNDGNPDIQVTTGGTADSFFKKIYEGGDLQYIAYDTSNKTIKKAGKINLEKGARDVIKTKIKAIYTKMNTKQLLDTADKTFLSSLPIPIFKLLNTAVISKTGENAFSFIAENIAVIQTKTLIKEVTNIISTGIRNYTATNKEFADEHTKFALNAIEKLNEINKQADALSEIANQEITTNSGILDYIKEKDQELKTKILSTNINIKL